MEIIEFKAGDTDLIDRAFAIATAAHHADTPENPAVPERFFRTLFTHVMPGRERYWFAAVEDGLALGYIRINFSTDDNLHLSRFELHVHPDHRGRGAEDLLLGQAERFCAEHGRTSLLTDVPAYWEGGPERDAAPARTLEARGYRLSLTSVNRRSPIDPLGADEERRRYEEALAKAGDAYEVRQWVGPVPEDLVDTMCRMETMILAEIPLGDVEAEPERMDAEKLRAKEAVYTAEGRTWVVSVAVERATGEVRAWTEVAVDEGVDRDGFQGITIVDPAHRGHRLGLLLKLANLRLLRERFPRLEYIWTDNADVNAPMIAINELMGYTTVDARVEYHKKLEG
ncbi:GNAT family N-acetyltransferase [Glycomyces sp. TRM65418]|uniref:GNAT family N-acetyltransferase n=1 Tax=Glycomyces sp. TRM65418 TaxID=2867006 RepID=UPI001CE585A9|nr:GNAT family N-acetyltransferase [Glycomyces sp. TRM65418]MCC3764270.1 GNAT family N-acetyltransferase [Glycomyces sp. TRM65418]QZD53954.1 GNAT family N-acetyltransferase [Glycomyces sp. TRM65418]